VLQLIIFHQDTCKKRRRYSELKFHDAMKLMSADSCSVQCSSSCVHCCCTEISVIAYWGQKHIEKNTDQHWSLLVKRAPDISHGSAATRLRCGGIFN